MLHPHEPAPGLTPDPRCRSLAAAQRIMCGFAVELRVNGQAEPDGLALLRHRGPDSEGEWRADDGRVWLGHTCLEDQLPAAGLPIQRAAHVAEPALPEDFARISWAELTGYMRHMLLRDSHA